MRDTDTRGKARGVSLDDDDAIDAGLFSSGPARIVESIFTHYDYGGNTKGTPVWLLTFERGEGKEKERYEQPYSVGKGWDISKDGLELIPKNGQTGLPKSCNAIMYLVKPLKVALKNAKLELNLSTGDPQVLEGMEVVVERIDQEERDIRDDKGRGRGDRDGRGGRSESKGPRTILVIDEVVELPGDEKPTRGKAGKGRGKAEPEEEEEAAPRRGKSKPAANDDEEDEAPPARGKAAARGKGKAEAEPEPNDLEDEAVEALIAVVEQGKVKVGTDLEDALEDVLKKKKNRGDIIDLATSAKFLELEKGWTYNGKVVDAET